jgi:ubiquinone/menaquinone biosynthesis C-methylase UbiE
MFRLEKFYPKGFNPQQYWDDKYSQEHIAGKSSDEFRKQGFWPLLQKHLDKKGRILDVGCGIGGWILFLKEEGYNVEGIDIAPRTVRALTEYDPDLKIKVASMTAIPYADDSLIGVLAIGTLEYVENKVPEALREVNRVLSPGGVFFMEVPIANVLRRLFYLPLKQIEKFIKQGRGQKSTFSNYLFDPAELKQMLRSAGFEIVEEQAHELPEADSHYGLYIDWPFLRGDRPYQLNSLGKVVKSFANEISPWVASTGMVVVARKLGK